MVLSDFQKKVVGSILQGKSCHIVDFVKEHCEYWPEKRGADIFAYGDARQFDADGFAVVVKNKDEAYFQVGAFLVLRQKLLNASLAIGIATRRGELPGVYYEDVAGGRRIAGEDMRMTAVIYQCTNEALVPTNELKRFVDNGYKTDEEMGQELQHDSLRAEAIDRKKSLRWTIALALFSIVISVVTTYYNVKSYTTERTVTIKNQADTSKVMLIMPSTVIKEVVPETKK
jgi:hypothetical protein